VSLAATLIGLATMFFGATGVFTELQDALDTIWEVQPKPGLGILEMIRDRFLSFAMVLVIGFLLLVSLLTSAFLTALTNRFSGMLPAELKFVQAGNFVISLIVITFLFALIYKVLPDVHVPWRDVWLGAALTAILFTVGKSLFGFYLGHSTIGSSYGASGSLVIVVLWTYYSALILLFGAEVTFVQAQLRGEHIEPTDIAVHLTEHDRIQQGIPHRAEEVQVVAAKERAAFGEQPQSPSACDPAKASRATRVAWVICGFALGWLLKCSRRR
jgi:membrane protein